VLPAHLIGGTVGMVKRSDETASRITVSMGTFTPRLPGPNRMRRRALVTAMAFIGTSHGGCVAWYEGTARKVEPFPTAAMQTAPRRALSIEMHYRLPPRKDPFLPEKKREYRQSLLAKIANEVVRESKSFVGSPLGQYRLNVLVLNSGSYSMALTILSGLTLLVVPAVATDVFDVEATLEDAFGRTIAVRHLRQEQTTLIELFMLFGMPFASLWQTEHRMWTQVFQDLLAFCEEESDRREGAQPPVHPSAPQEFSAPPSS
jgi:hypothetical protein